MRGERVVQRLAVHYAQPLAIMGNRAITLLRIYSQRRNRYTCVHPLVTCLASPTPDPVDSGPHGFYSQRLASSLLIAAASGSSLASVAHSGNQVRGR
jgi:hypothetical protein